MYKVATRQIVKRTLLAFLIATLTLLLLKRAPVSNELEPSPDRTVITRVTGYPASTSTAANNATEEPRRYLTIYPLDGSAGRLGNFCFRYAAALAMAKANGMTLILPNTSLVRDMRRVFKINVALESEIQNPPVKYKNITEKHWGMFDSGYYQLPPDVHIRLSWVYSQSWKYFYPIDDEVRHEFRFVESTREQSLSFVNETRQKYKPDYIIGMHVRRGDFLQAGHQRWGYAVAPADYFSRATQYYINKYGKNILFIVATDDRWWCQHNINFNGAKAQFSSNISPVIDLAILAACDHHVVSVGSFGWWGAWLGEGDVVYYKDFPTPGSKHATNHNPPDYYPMHWIPL